MIIDINSILNAGLSLLSPTLSIINYIAGYNEINCIYKKDNEEINLLYDYNEEVRGLQNNADKNLYIEAMKKRDLFGEIIDIFINNKKIKYNFKYKGSETGEIKVKFKINKVLTNISNMFQNCSSLKSVDLSSFGTTYYINNMNGIFYGCSSLESINFSSFNTNNVQYMKGMFSRCSSLKQLDLSSLNTRNVKDMSGMFYGCSSLKLLNLSSFETNNVKDMSFMFSRCTSLESINLSTFNTSNVNNMREMFSDCSSLEILNLSSFNTTNVNNMNYMFYFCKSLKSLDLSFFDFTNVNNEFLCGFLGKCFMLSKANVKINKKEKKILELINNLPK